MPCTSPQQYTELSEGAHSFEVKAIDQAGNADATPASFNWTIDTTPPAVQVDSGPAGLTNDPTPTFGFSSEPGAAFECSIDTGTPAFGPCSGASAHTPAAPLSDGPHSFRVRATDAATNQASAIRSFSVDTAAPPGPQLSATVPASPANDNNPKVIGSAPAATTIKLYTSADCSGSPLATGTAAELEAGIAVSVPDDSTTDFRATSTTAAENTSGCSEPLTYVEDSSAPETQIDSKPAALTNSATADFAFSGSDGAGSGVASFECRRDSGAWAPCTSPQQYTELSEGAHEFEARAIDAAGNVDPSPAAFAWAVDTTAPEPDQTQSQTDSGLPETKEPASPEPAELVRVVRNTKTGTALLIFKVPGPGLLSARPPEITLPRPQGSERTAADLRRLRLLQRRIKPQIVRVARPGQVEVPIELTAAGKKLLAKSHRLKVKVVVRFSSAGGSKTTWKIAVTLKQETAPPVTESRHEKK